MGAWRSLWRVSVWLGVVVCLAILFAPLASSQTREIFVADAGPGGATFFQDSSSGNSTTTITAGTGVLWRWGLPPSFVATFDLHSTREGLCTPTSCIFEENPLWNSELSTPGTFTRGPGTFGTAFSTGTATPLTVPFQTAGTYEYFCGFHGSAMTGTIVVQPAALHHFDVTGAPVTPVTAGQSFVVTVTARDQFNNKKTNYTGTVTFSVSSPHPSAGEVPANYTFVSGDQGDREFTFTLKTAGSRTITIQDGGVTKQFTVTVNPAATNQLVLTNVPATASAGTSFQVTVTARDQFSNTVTGYGGTVHFTSSDAGATLPADNTLISGTRNFNVTLANAGSQGLTVTDTVNGALTATANINVSVACAITFTNSAPITINDVAPGSPYPSTINVAGLKQNVSGISVTLTGLNHQFSRDTDILLVSPGGQKMVILSDSGGNNTVTNVTITLTDSATSLLPDIFESGLVSGTFKPTNNGVGDVFSGVAEPYSSPARAGSATFASVFNGTTANGQWDLYVVDAVGGGAGSISGGWSITFAPPANTFCNQSSIALPVVGQSTPYPSQLEVSNVDGTVRNASLRLDKVGKSFPIDVDLLLVSPSGSDQRKMIVLSDVGGSSPGTFNAVVTLDDAGGPLGLLTSGIFRPANAAPADSFAGAPAAPYSDPALGATLASAFGGINPNGTWSLYVVDDEFHPGVFPFFIPEQPGVIASGWALTFDVIFNTTTTLGSNLNPGVVGPIITLTANVTSSGSGIPTGTVTFRNGTTVLGTQPLVNGSTSFGVEFVAGTFNLTATYNGDANFHPSTSAILVQVVNPGATSTAVTSSSPLNTSTFGQSVTFTATVSDTSGFLSTTGTVTFKDGAATIGTGTVNASGVATLATSALVGGAHSITAVYNGNSNFLASTSPILTQTVNKATTTTAVVSSSPTSTYGNSVTFTATVTDSTASSPTGTVTFRDAVTTLGTGTLNGSGVAAITTSAVAGGTRSITAVYGGDANFNTSTSAGIIQTVNKRTPSTSLISFQGSPTTFGDELTLRADVTAMVTPPAASPTGTVSFKDGAATLGTIALSSGTAQFSISTLAGGSHNITAVYNGDGNYNTQTSDVLPHDVNPAETVTVVVSSLNPSILGEGVTLTATVTSGARIPAGTVSFRDGDVLLGPQTTLNSQGIATRTFFILSAGSHSITATYNGNGNFAASTSAPPLNQIVEKGAATILLSASKETSGFREAVTFTVTVSSTANDSPTGTVTFFDGATNLGSFSLDDVGQASITLSGLTVGKHEIAVQYGGDSNFLPGNSAAPLIHYRSPKPRRQP